MSEACAPYPQRKLYVTVRDFELAYDAYNTIKLDHVPLFTRLPSLPPDLALGTRIQVEVAAVDLLEMDFGCRFTSLE